MSAIDRRRPGRHRRGRHALRRSVGRRDIQGLRALAVLAVVAHHLTDWPRGGFIGVDVFFVVSGFLITGLLVRERTRTGRISFAQFYRRRVRRLMPTALLVVVATVLASVTVLSRSRAEGVAVDGLWSAAFAANWRFAAVGTDYFNSDATSPLQHYWSLAVEEQFYVVWPVVIVVATALAARRARAGGRLVLPVVIGVLTVVSFLYSLWHTQASPTYAYFSTLDRAWEFGIGALIAVTLRPAEGRSRRGSGLLGWSGLALIVASLFMIDPASAFPAPWALLPVVGTALVLAGGVSSDQRHLVPLVNPVATYVGNISYSLYLWHFPVTILLLVLMPEGGAKYVVVAAVLMTILSVWSYHAVENPIRHSTWLEPQGRGRPIDPVVRRGWALAAVFAVIGLAVVHAVDGDDAPELPAYALVSDSDRSIADQQSDQLTAALTQVSFPARLDDTDPTFAGWAERMEQEYCTDVSARNVQDCTWGDGDRLAVVYGDSFAMAWLPAVEPALTALGYRVQQLTMQQCPAWDASVTKEDGSPYPECDTFHRWALDEIEDLQPDLVLTSSAYWTVGRIVPAAGVDGATQVTTSFQNTADRIRAAGSTVVNLGSPPGSQAVATCYSRFGSAQDCVRPIQGSWQAVKVAEASVSGVVQLDTSAWFCRDDRCPGFFGATPVYTDGSHLDFGFARELSPLVGLTLLDEGLLEAD